MNLVIFVGVSLVSSIVWSSGNVGSSIKFPAKITEKPVTADQFKCEDGESVKDCLNRYKLAAKTKRKIGGQ